MKNPAPKFSVIVLSANKVFDSFMSHRDKTEWSKPVAIRKAKEFTAQHKKPCRVISADESAHNGVSVFETKTSQSVEFEHAELLLLKGILSNECINLNRQAMHSVDDVEKAAYKALVNSVFLIWQKVENELQA